jgi:hypothetical protein
VIGVVAVFASVPAAVLMAVAFLLYYLADTLIDGICEDEGYTCDMTVEEYEECIDTDVVKKRCDNCTFGDACLTKASDLCTDWMGVNAED